MTTNATDWNQLALDHELAYLRGDLATSSPESYTLDEMREISEAMDASTAEVGGLSGPKARVRFTTPFPVRSA